MGFVEPLNQFLTADFLKLTREALATAGFVTDEHEFAPYRETIVRYAPQIESGLRDGGYSGGALGTGFVADHPAAGYAYYIYDTNFFPDRSSCERAVRDWLNDRYRPGPSTESAESKEPAES